MVFSSYIFVFYFLPLVLAGYFALPARPTWRNAWLLGASYVFYAWWNPKFVLLMLGITLVTYVCGLVISRPDATPRQRRRSLVIAVVLCLGTLCFFKYLGFLQGNLNGVLAVIGAEPMGIWKIVLPVGISFYTFQALTYAVDVYRGHAPVARSFLDYACYIALFPQLVAGPIIHYKSVARDLRERRETLDRFSSGVALFILGFSKKVLIANPLGKVADAAFGAQALDAGGAWFGVIAYAFQIYFDFCGYSDMAVGLGRMFGFEFIKNFNAPYRAESITDFWRRWHISLSTFLRDYLYIPLGGNRLSSARTYANLAIVMLLGGLWHGANWTFVVWGAWHGAFLIAERWVGQKRIALSFLRPVRVAWTFVIVLGSWVWFRAETLPAALSYFGALFGNGATNETTALLSAQLHTAESFIVMAAAIAILMLPNQAHEWTERLTWRKVILLPPAFALALIAMITQRANPFLYFQF
ncbi:MAG: MBOAT family protein [Chthoniobacteraceae bacterium]